MLSSDDMKTAAVIGGGISGLTTAFLLLRKGCDVTIFEASDAIGGNVQTIQKNGYTIEQGPNSLLKSPRLVDLIRLLGLEADVVAANPEARKRYILSDGRLEPMGPKSFINGYFSLKTILALAREPFIRSSSPQGESVAQFVSRRINSELLDKAVDPFVSGIYAGDPHDLSVRAAFPKLFEMERDFGSLLIGSLRRKVEKPDPDFPRTFSFRGGLKTLIDRLAAEIGEDRLRRFTPVTGIEKPDRRGFQVNGERYDSVVISSPAWSAADLIRDRDARLAEALANVNYPQVAVAVTGYRSNNIGRKLDGFGFLIPSKERRPILGTLFPSAVFPERAPKGRQLLVTFLGGVRDGGRLDGMSDEEVKAMVTEQLGELLDIQGQPELFSLKRWKRAIPQYRVGYEQVTAACARFQEQNPGIYFCSNFYRGISMGDCVKNAFQTAEDVESYLHSPPPRPIE
jgi:protoporphyrinogen/coproporphyrinogen III oxidase